MIEDHEFDAWRQQWSSVAAAAPELPQIRRKIRQKNLRFLLSNLLAGIALLGGMLFAVFVTKQQTRLGTGWAAGIWALLLVSLGYRLWVQRGTWHAEAQSTRAFLELWQKRVRARIRSLRMASYIAPAWLAFCGLLAIANWGTIRLDFNAHRAEWLVSLAISAFMIPLIFLWLAWYRRRKVAELNEVNELLAQIRD